MDSAIATEMIGSAAQNSELDPYNVQSSLTNSDTEALQNALANKYGSVTTEEEKTVVDNIASVFGITLVP